MLPPRQGRRPSRQAWRPTHRAVHVVDAVLAAQSRKAEVARLQLAPALLVRAAVAVQRREDLARLAVGYVGDVLEAVGEGGDDEGVVVGEGALDQVKADAARVDDDEARDRRAAGVHDREAEGRFDEWEDVRGGAERGAGLAVGLGCAAV